MINEMSNIEIVERIDSLLKERNLKRQAVYDFARIAYNTFPNWTKREDTKIPAQALFQIAKFLNVSVEYLLTGKEADGMTAAEAEFLRKYKSLEPHDQNAVSVLLDGLYAQETGSPR